MPPRENPIALVYRGRASLPGCPEAVAALLTASRYNFRVRYVGPREELRLNRDSLACATIYVQPGGGSLESAWHRMRKHRKAIREFVTGGGRYVGICLGAYLAGATPGFKLLPGDTDQYIRSPHASVRSTAPEIVEVAWRGTPTTMYFQDGPDILIDSRLTDNPSVEILARYANGSVAALATPYGAGRVAVVGPHPEATADWFRDDHLPDRSDPRYRAGLDLIDAAMQPQF